MIGAKEEVKCKGIDRPPILSFTMEDLLHYSQSSLPSVALDSTFLSTWHWQNVFKYHDVFKSKDMV